MQLHYYFVCVIYILEELEYNGDLNKKDILNNSDMHLIKKTVFMIPNHSCMELEWCIPYINSVEHQVYV